MAYGGGCTTDWMVEELAKAGFAIVGPELKAALIEWRSARLGMFAAITEAFAKGKKDIRLPDEVWGRLGNAEWRLAELAEHIE